MVDIAKMSLAEIDAYRRKRADEERAAKEAAIRSVGVEARTKLEAELPKLLKKWFPDNEVAHTLSLASIFTASTEGRKVYRHPNGEEYNSRGKPPSWYSDASPKDREKWVVSGGKPKKAKGKVPEAPVGPLN